MEARRVASDKNLLQKSQEEQVKEADEIFAKYLEQIGKTPEEIQEILHPTKIIENLDEEVKIADEKFKRILEEDKKRASQTIHPIAEITQIEESKSKSKQSSLLNHSLFGRIPVQYQRSVSSPLLTSFSLYHQVHRERKVGSIDNNVPTIQTRGLSKSYHEADVD